VLVSGNGRSRFGNGKLDEKARAHRMIVFHVNGATVLGNNARGDREAQTGATILGGKLRKEEFVLVFRRDAVASIGDGNFDYLGIDVIASGDENLAAGGMFEGFGGIVDQIDDHAA